MKISVVIPTYNRRALICRAIESVVSQSYPPDEIIIVDDGSTDGTEILVKQIFPEIKYIYQSNCGVSIARNNGIAISRNRWIAFLDSDDVWKKDKLFTQITELTSNPEYKICHSNEIWFKNGKHINQKLKHRKRGGYIFKYCLPLCVISPSSILLHRNIFDEVGMFDETLPSCEDYDLWLRICSKYPVLYIDDVLVEKNGGHNDQLSMKYWGMDRFRIQALTKLLLSGSLTLEQIESVRETLRIKMEIYAEGAKKHKNLGAIYDCKVLTDLISYQSKC